MMAAKQYYIYTGGGRDAVPRSATHVTIDESITVIPAELFASHPNIIELICHVGVRRIEKHAFHNCPRLERVIIPGVEILEAEAFYGCEAVTYVECPKLEIIQSCAFIGCESLISIDLPSAKNVEASAFGCCLAMTDAKFGKNLESIAGDVFGECPSLKHITIPLKNGLLTANDMFHECESLRRVNLVEGEVLRNTVNALLLKEWRDDMNAEIDSINQILPNAPAGVDAGEKAVAIREWIARVLRKIIDYKAQQHGLLHEIVSTIQNALPYDIVSTFVRPFLELPSHSFEGEDQEQEDSDDDSESHPAVDEEEEQGEDNKDEEEEEVDNDDDFDDAGTNREGPEVEVEDGEEERKRRKIAD